MLEQSHGWAGLFVFIGPMEGDHLVAEDPFVRLCALAENTGSRAVRV